VDTIDQMDREIAAKQTHCYTCGNELPKHKIECPIWVVGSFDCGRI
jgi:hypothetical protein